MDRDDDTHSITVINVHRVVVIGPYEANGGKRKLRLQRPDTRALFDIIESLKGPHGPTRWVLAVHLIPVLILVHHIT